MCDSDSGSGDSSSCSVPDSTPCGPMSDSGAIHGPSTYDPMMSYQDLLIYGMAVEAMTMDNTGDIKRRRIAPHDFYQMTEERAFTPPCQETGFQWWFLGVYAAGAATMGVVWWLLS